MMRPMTLAVARSLAASPSLGCDRRSRSDHRSALDRQHAWRQPGDARQSRQRDRVPRRAGHRRLAAGVESTYTVIGQPSGQRHELRGHHDRRRHRVSLSRRRAERRRRVHVQHGHRGPAPVLRGVHHHADRRHGRRYRPEHARRRLRPVSDSPTFTITPSTGFTLADVLVDGVSIGATSTYQFTGVANDHTIWALFAPDTYYIVPSAGPNGSISADTTQTVTSGSDATFTITPDAGLPRRPADRRWREGPQHRDATRSRTSRPITPSK